MLIVKTPEETEQLINAEFAGIRCEAEEIPLYEAAGRVLAESVTAEEYVPGFDRSTVDGYAVKASDTFGCTEAIPAMLKVSGEILMGEKAGFMIRSGECAAVSTGGALPEGTDAAVMVEYTEDYGDGTVGILKSAAPGTNVILRGEDVSPGKIVLHEGRRLQAGDIGALAAMGICRVPVIRRPRAGIISTGDELVDIEMKPREGQVRDVNSAMLSALIEEAGGIPVRYGIVRDEEEILQRMLEKALEECDIVLISGGSSVGARDATCRVIESCGEVLFHGIAMKPGKPTILGKAMNRPVFGLPGHPGAACLVSELFVRPLISRMAGRSFAPECVSAVLAEAVSANHGRAQYMSVRLVEENGVLKAVPVHGKSGLITSLAGSDGFICIPRDCEGFAAGETVSVRLYSA